MKRRLTYLSLILLVLALACQPERSFTEDPEARLEFSLDTLFFDTVFTTLGTTTESFRIYNPHRQFVIIDEISLAGGSSSVFRINVDGEPGLQFRDVEIAPGDSMYIFVEATLDPNGSSDILRIQDSVLFVTNGNLQDVDLVAWGQDVHLIRGGYVEGEERWVADKPYLVMDYVYVDTSALLVIEEGVTVHMHHNALFFVDGSMRVEGSREDPVVFRGDRLEEFYQDIPGQWRFIYLSASSRGNSFEYTDILCGTMGLFISAPPELGSQPDLELHNSMINHMSSNGIYALNARIRASNLVVGNCGGSCAALIHSGSYDFTHCTFYNDWPAWYSNRQLPALFLADYFLNYDSAGNLEVISGGDFDEASFRNSIIYGNERMELVIDSYEDRDLNYRFDHCLTRIDTDSMDYLGDPLFSNIINNENPLLDSIPALYGPDSLSPAINAGLPAHALDFPFDRDGTNRLDDEAPDLGAFEWTGKGE